MTLNNLASFVLNEATAPSGQLAIAVPGQGGDLDGPRITFGDLRRRIARYQLGIDRAGLRPGDRIVLLFPVGIDFYALALALMASGQVLVFLDGSLDRRRFLRVLAAARAKAVVSVRALLRWWPMLPALWRTRRYVSDGVVVGAAPLAGLLGDTDAPANLAPPASQEQPVLLSFTSGSTGKPKGAERTQGVLSAQRAALIAHAPQRLGEVDMPCFPAVVLHNLSCGLTSVLPPIDLRRPGAADPALVAAAIAHYRVTSLSGAPAYLRLLADHAIRGPRPLDQIRRLYVGGAPVSRRLAALALRAFPRAHAQAVYGSTEAEPMAGVALEELAAAAGPGYLVGAPVPEAEIDLVSLPEFAPSLGAEGLAPYRVAAGESGEVLVRGQHVNRRYLGDEEANQRYKVPAPDGGLWHRTGDLARRDEEGRLWLTGRVPDRVDHEGRTLLPYILEHEIDQCVAAVRAAALIAHPAAPQGEVVLVCADADADAALGAVRTLLAERGLPRLPVRRVAAIPVDARHNSKIDRPALRAQLGRQRGAAPGGIR